MPYNAKSGGRQCDGYSYLTRVPSGPLSGVAVLFDRGGAGSVSVQKFASTNQRAPVSAR